MNEESASAFPHHEGKEEQLPRPYQSFSFSVPISQIMRRADAA